MAQQHLVAAKCRRCNWHDAVHTIVDTGAGAGEPVDGDVCVCIGCSSISVYEGGKLRPLTTTETREWTKAEVAAVQRVVFQVQRLGGGSDA